VKVVATLSQRQWAGIAMLLVLLLLFFVTKSQLSRDDVLPIEELRLEGSFSELDAAALGQVVTPMLKGNFFTIDVDAIHRTVGNMAWVDIVWVDRVWPNVLRVRVQEQRAVASWNDSALLNAEGDVFAQGEQHKAVIHLHGPDEEVQQVVDTFSQLQEIISQTELKMVMLKVDERLSWQLTLDNGLRLHLGRKDSVLRLKRFAAVYNAYLHQYATEVKSVDLRYANGFALERIVQKNS
jgi:cell division protein FtsQ